MRPRILIALLVTLAGTAHAATAHAECNWPPLGGITQKQENPVYVDGHRFGSAWYSYHVESYRIDSFHCSKSINSGPRGWDVIVESGRVVVNSEPQSGEATRRKADSPILGPALALPALPPLTQNMRPLPQQPVLAPLPDVKPLADVKPFSAMGQLPDLPALPQP